MKKSVSCFRLAIGVSSLLILASPSHADDAVRYRAKPIGNKVHIDGSSNVHDWKMDGTLIGGYLEVPAGVTLDSTQAAIAGAPDGKVPATAEVSIPVTSLKNSHGWEGMDEAMQAAMDAPTFPRIQYHLTELTLKQPHAAGTPLQFDTKGELIVHGVTNQITMPVTIENADAGKLKITGSAVAINMPDYKIKPPVKGGLFITKPDVKIAFEWVVGLPAKPGASK